MLALLIAMNIYTNLVTISNNLDVAYENVVRNKPGVVKDIRFIIEDIKYNQYLIDKSTTQGVKYSTILSLFHLSALQLQEYSNTGKLAVYKQSLSNKIHADGLLYLDNKK